MRPFQKIFSALMVWDGLRFLWAATWVDFWLQCGVSNTQLTHLKSWTASVCMVSLILLPYWHQHRRPLFLLGLTSTAGQFACMLVAYHAQAVWWLYASEACNAIALAAVQCVGHAYLIDAYQKDAEDRSPEKLLLWESRCGLLSALTGLCLGTWAYHKSVTGFLRCTCFSTIIVCILAAFLLPAEKRIAQPPPSTRWWLRQRAALRPLKKHCSHVLLWMSCAIMLQIAVHGWPWLLFQASNHHRSLSWTALSAAAQLLAQALSSVAWSWAGGRHHIKACVSGVVLFSGLLLWCWRQQWLLGCIVWVALLTLLASRIMLQCQMKLHDMLLDEQRVAVEATMGFAHRLLSIILLTGVSVINLV